MFNHCKERLGTHHSGVTGLNENSAMQFPQTLYSSFAALKWYNRGKVSFWQKNYKKVCDLVLSAHSSNTGNLFSFFFSLYFSALVIPTNKKISCVSDSEVSSKWDAIHRECWYVWLRHFVQHQNTDGQSTEVCGTAKYNHVIVPLCQEKDVLKYYCISQAILSFFLKKIIILNQSFTRYE